MNLTSSLSPLFIHDACLLQVAVIFSSLFRQILVARIAADA
jgi:hypothetical protein